MTICAECGYDIDHPHSTGLNLLSCTGCGRLRPAHELSAASAIARSVLDGPLFVGCCALALEQVANRVGQLAALHHSRGTGDQFVRGLREAESLIREVRKLPNGTAGVLIVTPDDEADTPPTSGDCGQFGGHPRNVKP